jgi:hypothetical protein
MRVCLKRRSKYRRRTLSEITKHGVGRLNARHVLKGRGLTITNRRRNIPTFLVFTMLSKVSLSDAMLFEVPFGCLNRYGSVDAIA